MSSVVHPDSLIGTLPHIDLDHRPYERIDMAFVDEDMRLLHKACREGDVVQIRKRARSLPLKKLDTRSPVTGRTALHEACANGHRDAAEELLNLGADSHKSTYLGGDTALHLGVMSRQRRLVFLLLRRGCNPNVLNTFGATCFHYAGTSPAIVKLLLRYGGKVSVHDRSRKTPWDCVNEGCSENGTLKKMMKEALEREKREKAEAEFALVKEEEDHANSKWAAANAVRKLDKVAHTALAYKSWREGRNP